MARKKDVTVIPRDTMTKQELKAELDNLISQKDLAAMLRVTIKTLCAWHRKGRNGRTLAKVRIGKHVFYRPDDVAVFKQAITGGR
jgi:hypothetical protein